MTNRLLILINVFLILECTSPQERAKDNTGSIGQTRKDPWDDSSHYFYQKKLFPLSIHDILPINGDTLIASTRFNGIILTTNAGKTWAQLGQTGVVSRLMIDEQRQLWGLYSWLGIHEADRSVIYVSRNLGKEWKKYELHTKDIFPATFYSKQHQALRVIDYNNRIFHPAIDNGLLKWTLVDSIPKGDTNEYSPWHGQGLVKDSKGRQWKFDGYGIYLIGNDTTKVY